MSTTVLYDRVHVVDEIHVIEIVTDPTAQIIEEVRWHCDGLTPSYQCGHEIEVAMSPEDALEIRAEILAVFAELGDTVAETAILATPDDE